MGERRRTKDCTETRKQSLQEGLLVIALADVREGHAVQILVMADCDA